MPYSWIKPPSRDDVCELHLWPHQSLRPGGFALFMGVTAAMLLLPLIAVLGSVMLWALLPFLVLAAVGVWLALKVSWRQRRILEVLRLNATDARLLRHEPGGNLREWGCNRYWAHPEMHVSGGPVPHYVTLRGCEREVEIGAFLSEDERKALFAELEQVFSEPAR